MGSRMAVVPIAEEEFAASADVRPTSSAIMVRIEIARFLVLDSVPNHFASSPFCPLFRTVHARFAVAFVLYTLDSSSWIIDSNYSFKSSGTTHSNYSIKSSRTLQWIQHFKSINFD